MAPLIALFLLVFWWIPTVVGSLPLPMRRFFTYTVRVSKRVVRGFFTFTLIRPTQRAAQRKGIFYGTWVFCLLLSLLLTLIVNIFSVPAGVHVLFVPLGAFLVAGYVLMKTFPHVFIARSLQPLPRRKRARRHKR